MEKTNVFKSNKTLTKVLALLLTAMCFIVFTASPACAATAPVKTTTKYMTAVSGDCPIKALNVYGKDKFVIKYDGKTIKSCTASQVKSDLGTGMVGAKGIKLTKKTSNKYTYQSKWALNLSLMPKAVFSIALKYVPQLGPISAIGTVCERTITYEVTANGTVRVVGNSFKWFTTLAKYKKVVSSLFNI